MTKNQLLALIQKDGVVDAPVDFNFVIEPKHVSRARCGCPSSCVLALALKDHFGKILKGWVASTTVVYLVFSDNKVHRFSTPGNIRRQIPVFDRTGEWNLPPGKYTLLAYQKQTRNRHRLIRGNRGGKRVVLNPRVLPTRASICYLRPRAA